MNSLEQLTLDDFKVLERFVADAHEALRRLDAIQELHRTSRGRLCLECGCEWPCPTTSILNRTRSGGAWTCQ